MSKQSDDHGTSVREYVTLFYPTVGQMPYCAALARGEFDKSQTLCAEVVELHRAFGTRAAIKASYLDKVARARRTGELDDESCESIINVIEDEGETPDHPDHLDMRLQVFSSIGLHRNSKLISDPTLADINSEWLSVTAEANTLTLVAVFAAIEDWYTGISALYEREYLKRGYSMHEIQTYTEHKGTDVWHSGVQFEVLERYSHLLDSTILATALTRAFRTSVGYDYMKLCWASHKTLDDLVRS